MVKEARRGSRGPKGQKPQKELRTNPSLSSEVDASGRPHLLPHRRGDAHRGEQLHPRPGLGGRRPLPAASASETAAAALGWVARDPHRSDRGVAGVAVRSPSRSDGARSRSLASLGPRGRTPWKPGASPRRRRDRETSAEPAACREP